MVAPWQSVRSPWARPHGRRRKPPPTAARRSRPTKRPVRPSVSPALLSVETVCSAAYWRRLCPELHVDDAAFCAHSTALTGASMAKTELDALRARLVDDGYLTTASSAELAAAVSLKAVRQGMQQLVAAGWPATLILLYDEAWVIAHHYGSLVSAACGGNVMSFDMLAWLINPAQQAWSKCPCAQQPTRPPTALEVHTIAKANPQDANPRGTVRSLGPGVPCIPRTLAPQAEGQAGFAPHRDRQPPDGSPQQGQTRPTGRARARLLRLQRARLAAPGGPPGAQPLPRMLVLVVSKVA